VDSNGAKEKSFSDDYIVIDDILIEKSLMDEVEKKVKKKWTVSKEEVDS
jgi:hypothetical protein